jgi:hypothetical protein
LPDAITLLSGKFFTSRRSRIGFKRFDALDDALQALFGYRVKVLYCRAFKKGQSVYLRSGDAAFGPCAKKPETLIA